jgi:AraC-like DNA-binding protein
VAGVGLPWCSSMGRVAFKADQEAAAVTVVRRPVSALPWPMSTGAVRAEEPNGLATVSFSTDELPERDRVTQWRDHYGQVVFKVDITPAKELPFEARAISRILPGLHLLNSTISTARVERARHFIADGNDEYALIINRSGEAMSSARGRELTLGRGDAVLLSCDEIATFHRANLGNAISLRVPRQLLSSLVSDIDDGVMRPIQRDSEALKLLTGYAATLIDENVLELPYLRQTVVNHVHDLMALTLGAARDAAETARDGGLRAARLAAAKTHIIQNSACQDISVVAVAFRLGVTPRYLQRLFEADGTTFSEFLLCQRLTHAYRMLRNPQFATYTVSSIAYEVGFGDLSYFNRCFRRQYGMTPSEVRETGPR